MNRHVYCARHIYASVDHNGKIYNLIFGHPYDMLRDKKISWEAKGYLSSTVNLQDEIDPPDSVIEELIRTGYLVEVK